MLASKNEGYSLCEDTHTLRLESKLSDLRVGYANPAPNGARVLATLSASTKKGTQKGAFVLAEREGFEPSERY